MARVEALRGLGRSLSRKLGGLSRMQKWYGVSEKRSRTTDEIEWPLDEDTKKRKMTARV